MKKTLLVLRGLPASGKSTWAKNLVQERLNYARLNKDDARASLFAGRKWKPQDEKIVVAHQTSAIKALLSLGINPVIDDTNLNPSHIERFKQIAKDEGNTEVEIKDFLDIPVEELIRRDNLRDKKVGRDVIYNMGFQYGLLKQERPWIGVDLDGTLADITERRKIAELPSGSIDYQKFFNPDYIKLDKVRWDVAEQVVKLSIQHKAEIIILSGRSDRTREATEEWLNKMSRQSILRKWTDEDNQEKSYHFAFNRLIMRPSHDSRPDEVLKKEFLDLYTDQSKLVCIVDDRPKMVRLWRSLGIETIDVGNGVEF